jgi:hypothetical protein
MDTIRKINALLQYHFKIDPDSLNEQQWAMKANELKWVLKIQKDINIF